MRIYNGVKTVRLERQNGFKLAVSIALDRFSNGELFFFNPFLSTGAPRLGNAQQRGDHYVTVKVEIPKSITDKERALIEQLKKEGGGGGGESGKGFFSK